MFKEGKLPHGWFQLRISTFYEAALRAVRRYLRMD